MAKRQIFSNIDTIVSLKREKLEGVVYKKPPYWQLPKDMMFKVNKRIFFICLIPWMISMPIITPFIFWSDFSLNLPNKYERESIEKAMFTGYSHSKIVQNKDLRTIVEELKIM